MAKTEMWQSPFASLVADFPAGLSEVGFPSQINLRGNSDDADFRTGIETAAGVALPLKANTVSSKKGSKILWLGPDEWLLVSAKPVDALLIKLNKALEGQHISYADVTANRAILQISGPHIHEVLMKSSNMDFHPRVFGPGRVAQTTLAKAPVIFEQVNDDSFHLYFRNSFARYCAEWLMDAFAEYET